MSRTTGKGRAKRPVETKAEREARIAESRRQAEISIRRHRLREYRKMESAERWDMLLDAEAAWRRAEGLRAFLRATEGAEAPSHAAEWVAWAWEKTEALDPLAPSAHLRLFMRVKHRRRVPDHELPEFSIFGLH